MGRREAIDQAAAPAIGQQNFQALSSGVVSMTWRSKPTHQWKIHEPKQVNTEKVKGGSSFTEAGCDAPPKIQKPLKNEFSSGKLFLPQ